MLIHKNSNEYQAVYIEDENLEILTDCPFCGGEDTLTQDCVPVWDLTQIVLRSYLCEQCDRLIFVFNEEFFGSLK